ncbi:MAG: DNA (cytosine-5-)-methyltransferase [Treponema sp.]|nr:DNA (cytosine-5-)-methyltransferase [Treponema sp.]
MEKTVCELFAGVGGFRLGLEKTLKGWNTVWFSQWEPGKKNQWAHDCYVKHFGDIDNNTGIDISLVNKKEIPDHNLLVGGFPCQDYSVARSLIGEQGINGKKGVLWWQIRDTLIAKETPFVLLENVDRLLKSPSKQRGRDFGIILACLNSLNYSAEWRVINAAEYGGPQRRRRIYIYAYKNTTKYGRSIGKITPETIISKEGFFSKSFNIENLSQISTKSIECEHIADISDTFSFKFENAGYMHNGQIFTAKVTPKLEAPIPLKSIMEKKVNEKYFIPADKLEKWKYLKGAKKIMRTSKSGFKYKFSEGAISFPDKIDLPARTLLTSESTLNRSSHVIEDFSTKKLRLLTPLETERIQGFDDNWTDTGMPHRFRYFCMGNALVVQMVTRMGNTLADIFDKEN